jgi:cytochrome c-type biogenesis protein CcmH/NrfF
MINTNKQNRSKQSHRLVHRLMVFPLLVVFVVLAMASSASAVVTKAQVKDVSGELICYCGCASKVVATCGCGTADKIEEDIAAQLESGQTKEDIVAAYLATHGEKGLSTPIASGFNLAAWLMPITAILIGGLVIGTTAVRWRGSKQARDEKDEDPSGANVSDDLVAKHQNRILSDLEEMN